MASSNSIETVVKQGGGLINVYRAVHHTTEIAPSMLYLNETAHANLHQTIEISNIGTKAQTYTLTHRSTRSLLAMDTSKNFWNAWPIPTDPTAATVTFSPATLTVQPGAKGSVQLSFTAPNLNSKNIGVYSGYIGIASAEDAELLGSVSAPYLGTVSDLSQESVIGVGGDGNGNTYPYLCDRDFKAIHNDASVFTLKPRANGNGNDTPVIYMSLRLGTRLIRVDLVSADTTFQPTVPIKETAQVQRRDLVRRAGTAFNDVPIIGNVWTGQGWNRDPTFTFWVELEQTVAGANGSQVKVANGKYRYLLRAARYGRDDYSSEDSYESYLSHVFEIKA